MKPNAKGLVTQDSSKCLKDVFQVKDIMTNRDIQEELNFPQLVTITQEKILLP